jgi:colanic acid biosynthesis glycosyl transferase WcaI
LELQNVNFVPIQPHSKFNRFLNLADAHLVIQKERASDLVMPSKLTTILAVGGLAIITADPGSGLHDLIKQYDIGILVEAENSEALKESILTVVDTDFSQINRNARKYAETFLSMNKIMVSYEDSIQDRRPGFAEITPESTPPVESGQPVQVVVESRSDVPMIGGSPP